MALVKMRTVVVGTALIGLLIWYLTSQPSTSGLHAAASRDKPSASPRRLLPGMLDIQLEGRDSAPAGFALQPDGSIVVAATTWSRSDLNSQRAAVLRLTSDGGLASPTATLLADTASTVSSVAPGRDGTIMVVGYGEPTRLWPVSDRQYLVGRLGPDGLPDRTFGGSGVVLANLRASRWMGATARGIAMDGDGGIVATGSAGYAIGPLSQGSYCATARFTPDGRFDRSFGDHGRVLTLLAGTEWCGSVAVLVASDRKIVVVGNTSARGFVLIRYLPNGALDSEFGRGGTVEFFDATAWGAAFDAQGRTLVVGTKWLTPSRMQFLVARYDAGGHLDGSFGAGGAVSLHEAAVSQQLVAAAVQPDGKIVAVGTSGWHSGTRTPDPAKRDQIVVVRLDPNGALDGSFAGGLLLIPSERYLWGADGVAIQPDGKLLVVGPVLDEGDNPRTRGIVVVRLNSNGTRDSDFGR